MDYETRDIDLWMKENLNNWVEQGTLSLEKSAQLQASIYKLANQERRNHFVRKLCGIVTAIITFIWLLFASCPAAAAASIGSPVHSTHFQQDIVVSLFLISIFLFMKFQMTNSNFEVNYE